MKSAPLASLALAALGLGAARVSGQEFGTDHGRIRHTEAGVTLQRASETFAEEATPNAPFFPGDRVWTESSGRAEFQFPDGSLVRLDARSKLDYLSHDQESRDETLSLRLWSGSVILHLRDGRGGPRFEIEAPGGLVSVSERGVYRVDAEAGETRLSVYEGEAVLDAGRRRMTVEDGESLAVRHGEPAEETRRFDREALDDFGLWDRERSLGEDDRGGRSARYLPAEVAPYANEFDSYGNWHYETEAGYVWAPSVQSGWQPYTNGRWAWTAYGWNFVPYEPWGWAVSHYGRWGFSVGLGWYWIPGRVWGPSWVSWAVGGDYVGWCPLGYRDRPVAGLGYAVTRDSGRGGSRGPGWSFARRGDLSARDFARRRVDESAVDVSGLKVAESLRARPTRDLHALETAPARGAYDPGTARGARRSEAVPGVAWPGAARREDDASRYRGRQSAPRAADPESRTTRPRREDTPTRWDGSEAAPRSARRPMPLAAPLSRAAAEERDPAREAPAPANREARPRDREPDRDAMRELFRPLSEPRSSAPRGGGDGERPRGERPAPASGASARPERKPPEASAPRTSPPPRQESRPPAQSRGGDAERRKPPRDH